MRRDDLDRRIKEAVVTARGDRKQAVHNLKLMAEMDPRLLMALVAPFLPGILQHAIDRVTGVGPAEILDARPPEPARPAAPPPAPAPATGHRRDPHAIDIQIGPKGGARPAPAPPPTPAHAAPAAPAHPAPASRPRPAPAPRTAAEELAAELLGGVPVRGGPRLTPQHLTAETMDKLVDRLDRRFAGQSGQKSGRAKTAAEELAEEMLAQRSGKTKPGPRHRAALSEIAGAFKKY